jgi:2-amino-4-hydroxy-6-hydroxymethyldihydropteridine diphosphokinase
MPQVYLGLGSNLGDRSANLYTGIQLLGEALTDIAISSVYQTEPVGVRDQPAFLNLVLCGRTTLSPHPLLDFVKQVERRVGRTPTFRWGPRVLDVDILLYDDEVVADPDLIIPHRELKHRAFVLVPLHELAPALRLPDGTCVANLLAALDTPAGAVRRLGPLAKVRAQLTAQEPA